ncbi:MAG: BolA family transcriptional regulator [Myxococcales bacterium]|nr:BolA family transcriptional regulator [Myxococcales bacterium]
MELRERIENRLRDALAAERVEIVDESHLHVGHEGARGGGGHLRAVIVSDRFAGQSAVERQRMVYGVLADEMKAEIHALSMQTLTPDEWNQQD